MRHEQTYLTTNGGCIHKLKIASIGSCFISNLTQKRIIRAALVKDMPWHLEIYIYC